MQINHVSSLKKLEIIPLIANGTLNFSDCILIFHKMIKLLSSNFINLQKFRGNMCDQLFTSFQ